ncbi:MAG: hypothetical protein GC191_15525 [Azospirillum sp.]|nr:hypothetical protein [Azospirillum sp.]
MKKALFVLLIALIGVLPVTIPVTAGAQTKPAEASELITPENRNILLVIAGTLGGVALTSAIFNSASAPEAILSASGIGPIGFLASAVIGGFVGNWANSKL